MLFRSGYICLRGDVLCFSSCTVNLSTCLCSLAHFENSFCALVAASCLRSATNSACCFFCSLKAFAVGVGRRLYKFHAWKLLEPQRSLHATATYQSVYHCYPKRVDQVNGNLQHKHYKQERNHLERVYADVSACCSENCQLQGS